MSRQNIVKRNVVLVSIFFFVLLILMNAKGSAQTILFEDDFESGNSNNWELEPGWEIKNDNGNYVLSGETHAFARNGSLIWNNYSLKTKVKLMDDMSYVHLNYRNRICERYFVGFYSKGLYLKKTFPCGTHTNLTKVDEPFDSDRWYLIEIAGNQNNIKIYVDGILKIDYTDNTNPILAGQFSFETLDNSHVYIDDVVITSDENISLKKWTATEGPLGGLGYDVRIHPADKNVMYVTDNFAGVLKSNNAGETWRQSNSGISTKSGATRDCVNIFSLTIDPNNPDIVWAGTYGEGKEFGVFKSIDGGETWEEKISGISLGSDLGLVFRGFTIEEGNSDVVYAQAEVPTLVNGREFNKVKGRVYKTFDGGENWDLIWEGDNLARYLIVDPINPDILYLSTGIFDREAYNSDCSNNVSGGVGVLKSVDGGKNWFPINNGLTDLYVGTLRMHPTDHNILFAGAGNNACSYTNCGLFRTTDGGLKWKKVIDEGSEGIITTVNFSASNPDVVYAGSPFAFFQSTDGGKTWRKYYKEDYNNWGPSGVRAGFPIDVIIDPNNYKMLYANNYGGGVFRSVDGAKTWEDWSKGYSGAQLSGISCSYDGCSTVYAIGRSGPFISKNYGENWVGIAKGDATAPEWYTIAAHPSEANIVLMSDEFSGIIYRSTDKGNLFNEVFRHPAITNDDPNRRQGFKTITYAQSNPKIVYAGLARDRLTLFNSPTYGTVLYKSTNTGLSFTAMPSILDGLSINKLVVYPSDPDTVYAATSNGVYKTEDGAKTWNHLDALGNKFIETLALDPHQTNFIVAGETFGGIWVSTDGGETWTGPQNSGFSSGNPYITAIEFDPTNSNVIYASDLYSGIYQSIDKGNIWSAFPDMQMSGLKNRSVKKIAIDEVVIYLATEGGGVFRYWRPPLIPDPLLGNFEFLQNQTFHITNSEPEDITIEKISIAGSDREDFFIEEDTCSGKSLAYSEKCSLEVSFSPIKDGIRSARLEIVSNYSNMSTFSLPLSNSGFNKNASGIAENDDNGGGGGSGGGCYINDLK